MTSKKNRNVTLTFIAITVIMLGSLLFFGELPKNNVKEGELLHVIGRQNLTDRATVYLLYVDGRKFVALNSTNGVALTRY